jgi:hypothetical protein
MAMRFRYSELSAFSSTLANRPLVQTMLSDELIETRSPSYLISSIHTGPERTALVAMQNSSGLNSGDQPCILSMPGTKTL